jgi:hypothetical protein
MDGGDVVARHAEDSEVEFALALLAEVPEVKHLRGVLWR